MLFECFATLSRPPKEQHCSKKNQDIRQTSFPRDAEIEWEYALAVTHYYWLTGVIEFCLGKKEQKTDLFIHFWWKHEHWKSQHSPAYFYFIFYNTWVPLELTYTLCTCTHISLEVQSVELNQLTSKRLMLSSGYSLVGVSHRTLWDCGGWTSPGVWGHTSPE